MSLLRRLDPRRYDRALLLELFVAGNLAFLVVDIWVAHSFNDFHHPAEWIPLLYAGVGAAILVGNLLLGDDPRAGRGWWLGVVVGGLGVLVGVSGLVWHLESHFFELRTLRSLVYSAPFVAPLAFTGIGFLLLLNRLVPEEEEEWGRWIVLLAFGGFVGNFGLSLADHAQNGFFDPLEWIPVVVSAVGVGYLTVVLLSRPPRRFLRWAWWVLGLQAVTGVLGFGLHVAPIVGDPGGSLFESVVYGPPVFAPLLFPNLALLAGLGVWDLHERREEA